MGTDCIKPAGLLIGWYKLNALKFYKLINILTFVGQLSQTTAAFSTVLITFSYISRYGLLLSALFLCYNFDMQRC